MKELKKLLCQVLIALLNFYGDEGRKIFKNLMEYIKFDLIK